MQNYKLSKEDEEYLNNYRNKDGSPLTEVQRDTMISLIMANRAVEYEGRKFTEKETKPKPLIKPSPVEDAIYAGRRLGFQVDTEVPVETPVDLSSYNPEQAFVFKYDDFGRALISKVNEKFRDTKAEIPARNLRRDQEIQNMHFLKRSALVTIISENPELRELNLLPVSPLESERLLQGNRLPKPAGEYWEDLALCLYDHSEKGTNPREAQALYESIKEHKEELGLRNGDLEERLLVVNAGLDVDNTFPKGVKPKVIPGITQVSKHETLKRTGRNHNFAYGLENGLPSSSQLGRGNRTLYMPSADENIGLRVLCCSRYLNLGAWVEFLVNSNEDGRVTFAKKSP